MSGCRKVTYLSKKEAKQAVQSCRTAAERGIDRRKEWRVYRCQSCTFYHLTSEPHAKFGMVPA